MAEEDDVYFAPLDVVMAEVERLIEKWQATLDWLAER